VLVQLCGYSHKRVSIQRCFAVWGTPVGLGIGRAFGEDVCEGVGLAAQKNMLRTRTRVRVRSGGATTGVAINTFPLQRRLPLGYVQQPPIRMREYATSLHGTDQ
jgi:hypothetical protein